MTIRKCHVCPGARAWIRSTSSAEAAVGWPNGLPVTIVACEAGNVTVRDGAGRELTLPDYSLDTGYEYEGRSGAWVHESDPRVLAHLRKQRVEISRMRWDPAVDRYRADVMANIDVVLARNAN